MAPGRINQWDRQCFTANCHHDFKKFAALVGLTYTLSHRDDTEYWREIQNREWPELLQPEIMWGYPTAFYEKMIVGEFDSVGAFPCVAAGMHWPPLDVHTLKYRNHMWEFDMNYDYYITQLENRRDRWHKQVKDFPSPYQYLKKHVYK